MENPKQHTDLYGNTKLNKANVFELRKPDDKHIIRLFLCP